MIAANNDTDLENAGTIGSSPGVEEIVLASGDKPLAAVGKLEGENAALMQVQLVLVWLGVVQHLHVAALHAAHTQQPLLHAAPHAHCPLRMLPLTHAACHARCPSSPILLCVTANQFHH